MKKLISAMAITAVMALAACSGNKTAEQNAQPQEEPAEAPAEVTEEEVVVVDEEAVPAEAVEEAAPAAATEAKPAGDGYTTTASGLKYKVLRQGNGIKPKANDLVTVHYEGRLPNGQVFDSSYQRGETIQFGLNQVIAGWTEGLQLMPVGSKYQFYIPSNLAYGERGAGGIIGPNQDLIFDVELISVP